MTAEPMPVADAPSTADTFDAGNDATGGLPDTPVTHSYAPDWQNTQLATHVATPMAEEQPEVREIVERAQALGPRERAEFVRQSCGSDETLLSRVLDALGNDAQEPAFWDERPGNSAAEAPLTLEGQRLGRYRILRKLGTGGMGDVYLAERADEEYQQQVAIKLVRAGAFSSQVQSRLRMERQILATLEHPNIARLLDGGRTADGTPYLVMEYIDGEPIDTYCDRRRLPLAQRIALVRTVCAAVHYAHQNLIVHRDLKPNNILVTTQGVPKLLDFGIAKLLDSRQSLHTLAVTHLDYRVMTPAHASPEQIRGDVITTSSDVYVLGVLLYELLSGRRPFQFVGARITDMERMICDQDPVAPSAMARRSTEESPQLAGDIAECRSTTPARLQKELHGDIDNIILMAMRKDVGRRYSSAEQLSADLEKHLTGQPVLATSDTWLYRTRKFVARHTLAVVASIAGLLTLTAFAASTYVQSQRVARERDIAAAERTRAEQVSSFLVELFELSDPSKSRGNQVTARELLDIGARRVSSGLNDQPGTRATLLSTIGRTYGSLGLYPDAVRLQREALAARQRLYGARNPEVAAAMAALGDTLQEQGELAEAGKQLNAALQMQRELLGPTAVAIGPTLMDLGHLAEQRGALNVAERYYEESIDIFRKNQMERRPEAASVMNDLAGLYLQRSDYDRAAQLYRTALDIDRQALGQDHPQIGIHIQSLALTLHRQGKLKEAEPLYIESVQLLQRVLGEQHPHTLDALANYGSFLRRKGDYPGSESVLRSVLERDLSARGSRHLYVGHDRVNLANLLMDEGRYADAERETRTALDIYKEALPDDSPFVAAALSALGRAQAGQGNARDAETTLRHAITIGTPALPADSPPLAVAKSTLGGLLVAQKNYDEASRVLRESYPVLVQTQGEEAPVTKEARTATAELEAQTRQKR
ncbi:MAG TPA: tetratricopeptide repeat protein [Steroidobacteraceae bacterium]